MRTIHPLDQEMFPPFSGFPKEGLAFLKRLKKNNNRPWFQKHKQEYDELVKFPMQCLIGSLAIEMGPDASEIEFNPLKSIFRIYRDVRFSKNKAPYKTSVAASFQIRGFNDRHESPGLYLHVQPGQIFLGGGLYMPMGDQLKAIRKSIVTDPDRYLDVVRNRQFRKTFGEIQGEMLRNAPLGFPKDHPMIEHLRHKQFFVGIELNESACFKEDFLHKVAGTFGTAMPLVRWLAEVR